VNSWPLSPEAPRSHLNLRDRRIAAQTFLSLWPAFSHELHGSYIDGMENSNTIAYGLWPERYLVVRDGVVTWASQLTEEPVIELRRAAAASFL